MRVGAAGKSRVSTELPVRSMYSTPIQLPQVPAHGLSCGSKEGNAVNLFAVVLGKVWRDDKQFADPN